MPVWRGEPLPHCGGRSPIFRCAGGGNTFDERAALRSQLDTGQRLQRAHGARLFCGRQERQKPDDLEARLESRRRELDLEADLVNVPPTVVAYSCWLIVFP